MKNNAIVIGSRGSDLALWQAHWVRDALRRVHQGVDVSITIIKTTGDRILDSPLSKIGDKGLFTKEIEQALLEGTIDLAVHSLKDLPTELPAGLMIGSICEREDVRDVFIPHPSNRIKTVLDQPRGASIATGSLRRKCQLLSARPDLTIMDVRGNLNTRLRKLDDSQWAGLILARAGVVRLGWEDRIGETIDPTIILPAVGQGALGIEVREHDNRVRELVAALHHVPTAHAALAERALLRELEGGCQVPIGTYGRIESGTLRLDGMVGSLDGKITVRGNIEGPPEDGEVLGTRLATILRSEGADEILQGIRSSPVRKEE